MRSLLFLAAPDLCVNVKLEYQNIETGARYEEPLLFLKSNVASWPSADGRLQRMAEFRRASLKIDLHMRHQSRNLITRI